MDSKTDCRISFDRALIQASTVSLSSSRSDSRFCSLLSFSASSLISAKRSASLPAVAKTRSADVAAWWAMMSPTRLRQGSAGGMRPSLRSSRWHREMMVGSSASGLSVTSRKSVRSPGSSSVLRKAFAALSLSRSAKRTTQIFQPPA